MHNSLYIIRKFTKSILWILQVLQVSLFSWIAFWCLNMKRNSRNPPKNSSSDFLWRHQKYNTAHEQYWREAQWEIARLQMSTQHEWEHSSSDDMWQQKLRLLCKYWRCSHDHRSHALNKWKWTRWYHNLPIFVTCESQFVWNIFNSIQFWHSEDFFWSSW